MPSAFSCQAKNSPNKRGACLASARPPGQNLGEAGSNPSFSQIKKKSANHEGCRISWLHTVNDIITYFKETKAYIYTPKLS